MTGSLRFTAGQVLLYTAVLLIVLWTLAPFYWMAVSSVSDQRDLLSFPPQWFQRTISLERFQLLLGLADPATLERVLFHLLQEYARHVGHLDIVTELATGASGE